MVDDCVLLLYLVEVKIEFIDWRFGVKRDGFLGVVKLEKFRRGTLYPVEYPYRERFPLCGGNQWYESGKREDWNQAGFCFSRIFLARAKSFSETRIFISPRPSVEKG